MKLTALICIGIFTCFYTTSCTPPNKARIEALGAENLELLSQLNDLLIGINTPQQAEQAIPRIKLLHRQFLTNIQQLNDCAAKEESKTLPIPPAEFSAKKTSLKNNIYWHYIRLRMRNTKIITQSAFRHELELLEKDLYPSSALKRKPNKNND